MVVRAAHSPCRSLPENDQSAYYSDEDEEDSDCDWNEPGPSQYTNRNHKLRVKDGMRWIHRGKLGDWTEARADSELHQREDRRIHAFQHASVEALLEAEAHMIGSMGAMLRDPVQQKRRRMGMLSKRNKRRKCAYDEDNDLLSDDMDQEEQLSLSAATLAPSLLLPVLNAHDLLKSRLLKQVFNNSHITSLSRTALDLRESEHNMKHALGRCFGVMERIFDSDPRETDTNAVGTVNKRVNVENSKSMRSEMLQVEKGNDEHTEKVDKHHEEGPNNQGSTEQHDVKDEQNEGELSTADAIHPTSAPADSPHVFDPMAPLDDAPPLAQINNLFLTKGGLTVPMPDSNPESDAPQTITISEEEQRDIVYASLGCLNDLYMDSLEYMERLDEVRSILSDIERHRNHVWNMLRMWATKRDNEEYRASTMYRNARANLRSARGSKSGNRTFGQGADDVKTSNTASTSVGDRGSGEYAGSSSRSRAKRRANK